jgi:hypothetical protein
MQHLEVSGTPVLYIGCMVLKPYFFQASHDRYVIHSIKN